MEIKSDLSAAYQQVTALTTTKEQLLADAIVDLLRKEAQDEH
ncbi:hypothetical protein [Streptococcus gallolyticus]|nr:hypothetical protein [Streptococcus gallolyticus]